MAQIMNLTKFLRKELQDKLEQGKVDSLAVQVISLIHFAQLSGWEVVNGNVKKGFKRYNPETWNDEFMSLQNMQLSYNYEHYYFMSQYDRVVHKDKKIVSRISMQYNKRTSKQLTTQLKWLKFMKEE